MFKKTVLDNGLKIITENLPQSRLVSVGILIDVGSRDEHDLNNGCAHFVEHMLFKGTSNRSAEQIAREFDVLGGTANAFTSREGTCYYATVLDNHLAKIVELFVDLLLNSNIAEDEVKRERQVILQEIDMVEDTPDDYIHDLFASLLWGRHPLGNTVLGSRGVVAAMDSKKLADYVARNYTPDRIIISAAGNVEHDEFVELWRDLAAIKNNGCDNGLARVKPVKTAPQRAIYSKPLEQVHVVLGTHGLASAAEERYAYLLLNVLLGANMSSRLFQEIREKHGLAYSVYSYISAYFDCGYISIYLGVNKNSMNEALTRTLREVHRLATEPIPPEEFANAQEFVKAGIYLSAENMESIMMRIARNELTLGHHVTLDEAAAAIDQVRGDEVEELADRIFGQGDLAMAALGPLGADEIDLGAF